MQMINLVTGKSGSGKSYKVVSSLMEVIDTRKVITNLKLSISHPNYIYKTEGEIKEYILMISNLFEDVKDFPRLVETLKDREFYNADFYIDECHLVGFRKRIDGLINWLSVRRHLNQNIVLITQTLKKIHSDYIPDIHYHYQMIPQNKRVNQNMIGWYKYDEVGGDKIETKYISPNKEIFEIYETGKGESSLNKAVFKLFGVVGLIVLALLFVYFSFISGMSNTHDSFETMNNYIDTNGTVHKNKNDVNDTNDLSYVDCTMYISKPNNWILAQKIGNSWYCCTLEKKQRG